MSTIQELGDKLAALSLKDAVELGKYLKDTYGIEPAAGGAVVMAAAGGGGGAAKAEEKTSFDVILKAVDAAKKIAVIKVVRELTGLGLAEAKAFADAPGKPIKQGVSKEEADKISKQVTEAGGTVELA
ncbi:MAG: 50S ribosomal protein L7/L12 [Phycisphaeraceae bacterium]|nr:50S ribosomal protein L7/L12 [Phycisphaeraceae bacterium]MBX3405564.1 50S ribosomal protein L7/L12 [Phycisphaeraceae bacterium]